MWGLSGGLAIGLPPVLKVYNPLFLAHNFFFLVLSLLSNHTFSLVLLSGEIFFVLLIHYFASLSPSASLSTSFSISAKQVLPHFSFWLSSLVLINLSFSLAQMI